MSQSRNKVESGKGIELSGRCCIICGWAQKDPKKNSLIIGAHVRVYRKVKDYDKRSNIIALCPNHHIEFDRGCLTIDPDKKICLHIDSKDDFHNKKIVGSIKHIKRGYFDYHTKHIFKGKM